MTKVELINKASEKAGVTKVSCEKTLNAILESIVEGVVIDGGVKLVGFGSFEIRERKERNGVNPKTGESIKITASKTVGFKCGKALKDAVNV